MRIIYSSVQEGKSRALMSCELAQEMWSRMETAYLETSDEIAPVLWRKFYGSKIQQGQSVMEFMTEMEQIVSRLRAINGIVLEDGQIITQILMSLPPSLKLNFVVAWDSTPAQEKTLKNLTIRLVKMEKNVKQSEEENSSNALPAGIIENVPVNQVEKGEVVAQDQAQNEFDAHLPDEPIVHEQEDDQLVNQP
ncbi:hypothetical protein GHT06_018611 [Daphnia sinensis]|uniref:Uncharacterized protein n=1 Tax=Daphnia sinensis TaxID=1820382 RepID=A0AAD5KNF3_9CRUS|nr:hypothetical protein GHT06_018611 [Daphnia sinensis]